MAATPEGEAPDLRGAKRILSMLLVAFAVSYADVALIASLRKSVREEFHLSDLQSGPLFGAALALVYALAALPLAKLADRVNRRWIITLSLLLWGGFTLACGFAWNFWQLFGGRMGAAFCLAALTPAALSIIADYRHTGERARAIGIFSLGIPIGLMAGGLLSSWITQEYNWRIACFAIGAPGVVMAFLFRAVISKGRPRHEPITHDDHELHTAPLGPRSKKPSLLHLTIGLTLVAFVGFAFFKFMLALLARNYPLSDMQAGALAALINGLGGALGIYAGGALAQRWTVRDFRFQARIPAMVCVLAAVVFALALIQGALWLLSALMVLGIILLCMSFAPAFASILDAAPYESRAMSVGWTMFFIGIVGMGLGPLALGIVSNKFAAANFDPAMMFHGLDYATACANRVLAGNEQSCAAAAASGLRQAMFVITALLLWAAAHFARAARTLHVDSGLPKPEPKPKKPRRSIHDDEEH
ncbi:MAG: MFS transporter [Caulobacterales bacterium]